MFRQVSATVCSDGPRFPKRESWMFFWSLRDTSALGKVASFDFEIQSSDVWMLEEKINTLILLRYSKLINNGYFRELQSFSRVRPNGEDERRVH